MDDELYDEFGNYIGPDLGSEGESSEASDSDYDENGSGGEPGRIDAPQSSLPLDHDVPMYDAPEPHDDIRSRDEPQQQQVVLYHDKNYFPQASEVYGEGVETMVQEEDTVPLETPIVAPVDENVFSLAEKELPDTVFDWRFVTGLMDAPSLVRNVALVGHLHAGKTALCDMWVRRTHALGQRADVVDFRFTDTRLDERSKKIGVKSSPLSLVLPAVEGDGKSYLINMMDTPGHPNFIDEQVAAIRLSDGIVLVVDAVEGVMVGTQKSIRLAVQSRLPVVLVINKVDRLITELRLPPSDAYFKLQFIIRDVNNSLRTAGYAYKTLNPVRGDVVFASAKYGWCFTVESMAMKYAADQQLKPGEAALDVQRFTKHLWGDLYFVPESRTFAKQGSTRSFVQFCLEPVYKLYSHVLAGETVRIQEAAGLKLTKKELQDDAVPLLRKVLSAFFESCSSGFVQAIVDHIHSPVENAHLKTESTYAGDLNTQLAEGLKECDRRAPLMVQIAKQYPRTDCSVLDAFGRVMSGTLSVGDRVRVLREAYSLDDDEDMTVRQITKIWIFNSRYRVQVSQCPAGSWCLLEGLDNAIAKTATLAALDDAPEACIFRPLQFDTEAVMKVAIEPLKPNELPKMLDGLRRINQSYPLAHTKVEESGEHTVLGTGELYLDCILHDLRIMFADIEIKVSDPVVCFQETVIDTSSIKCYAETPNKHNKLTMIAEPLDQGLAADLERSDGGLKLDGSMPKKEVADFLKTNYGWDALASRSVWACGPDPSGGPNLLIDDTLSDETDKQLLSMVRPSIIQGFRWGVREGPLCDEPIRNVGFKLIEARLSDQPLLRGGSQLIPTARRVLYSAFLLANPRLMEPILAVHVQTPADCIAAIHKVLQRRRGHVTLERPNPGTPLFEMQAFIPAIDSFGLETDLRTHTQGQGFCVLAFDHWAIVPGDPLDKDIVLRPLEPSLPPALAREFMIKTRKRKGLSEDVSIGKYFDDPMLLSLAAQDDELKALLG